MTTFQAKTTTANDNAWASDYGSTFARIRRAPPLIGWPSVSMLAERLKCPRCGSRRVVLQFDLPTSAMTKHAHKSHEVIEYCGTLFPLGALHSHRSFPNGSI